MNEKLENYINNLIDISYKNKLINFRPSLTNSVLLVEDFYSFYDKIINSEKLKFAMLFDSLSDLITSDDLLENESKKEELSKKIVKYKDGFYPLKDLYDYREIEDLKKDYKEDNLVFSNTLTKKLKKTLKYIQKKDQVNFNELGYRSLYLAFGLLKYKDKDQEYSAPLCLLKVNLTINNKGYFLSKDTVIFEQNEALVYKFKHDHNIDISKDEDDLSIENYIESVKEKLKGLDISIEKDIYLSNFSFEKIIMYLDLEKNRDNLEKNKLLRALFEMDEDNEYLFKNEKVVDTSNEIEKLNLVINADSSQQKAIWYAKEGKSFILEGPPGCGKSQTITNIISSLLADNKKILFVCEKKSALDIVKNNLKKAYLLDYALPLYELKSDSTSWLLEIYNLFNNLTTKDINLSDEATELLSDLSYYDYYLRKYEGLLEDKVDNLDFTLNDLINYSMSEYDDIEFDIENINEVNSKMLKDLKLKLDSLSKIDLGFSSPFKGLKIKTLSNSKFETIKQKNNNLLNLFAKLIKMVENSIFKEKDIAYIEDVSKMLKEKPEVYLDRSLLDISNFHVDELKELKKLFVDIKKLKSEIEKKYEQSIYDLDANLEIEKLEEWHKHKILKRKEYNSEKTYIESFLLKSKTLIHEDMIHDLKKIASIQEIYERINTLESNLATISKFYFSSKTDFDDLIMKFSFITEANKLKDKLKISKDELYELLLISGDTKNYDQIIKLINEMKPDLSYLNELFVYDLTKENVNDLFLSIKMMSLNYENIFAYVEYNKIVSSIDDKFASFKNVIYKIDTNYYEVFLKRYSKLYLDYLYVYNKDLFALSDSTIKSNLDKYQNDFENVFEISKVRIKSKINESLDAYSKLSLGNHEVKELFKEISKKKNKKSVRQILNTMPNLISNLKPLFMATPSIVSAYLDYDKYKFDVIIFDEASQIRSEVALSSILRAKQMIVVGDKYQLPPTSFFEKDSDDEFDLYDSILDESRTFLNSIPLRWHYRSKDESLIYFSNKEIYKNLYTFPSSKNDDYGIEYDYIEDATYQPLKRINVKEAYEVVEKVFYTFRHHPQKSVGVVTFNIAQEELIEELILDYRMHHKEYESFFDDANTTPFFVKNLESVQGDERDIIILSTTYSKFEDGTYPSHFGPLQKDDGYKRLNVAITRAKEKIILITSLDPLKLNSKARGIQMLKNYLIFARDKNYDEIDNLSMRSNNYINKIKNIITENGYKADIYVGKSEFKIDLIIKDENDNYLAAILLDHKDNSDLTNFDRYYLSDYILNNRNFKVYHLFIISSYKNLKEEINSIIEMIKNDNKSSNDENINLIKENTKQLLDVNLLFEPFPNVYSLAKEEFAKEGDTLNKLKNLIYKISPISVDDLIKILDNIVDEDEINQTILELKKMRAIYKVLNFVLKPDDLFLIKFRRYDSLNPYNRGISQIYVEELEAGFKEILSYVKETSKEALFETFNTLIGYPKNDFKTHKEYNKVLGILKDKNIIEITDEYITYK